MQQTCSPFCPHQQGTLLSSGGALGGDVLHEAEPWGLGLPWGDANITGQPACCDHMSF